MNEDKTRICVLYDIYGELLSPSASGFIDLYYNNDLSLSEIAENTGISRQGVRDGIKRGVALLENYEQKLGLYEKYRENEKIVDDARSAIRSCGLPAGSADAIISLLDKLSF